MNILVIEDEKKTADTICSGLTESGYKADAAYDGVQGLEMGMSGKYQLIISDIIMPGINGMELCERLRKHNPDLLILMLTALDSKDDVVKGLDAGADDYLTKPFDFRELLARIRSLSKRIENRQKSTVLLFADVRMDTETKTVTRQGKNINLTAKEFELLEYFMRSPGKVISRNELSENIWNIDFATGTNFVEVYINYLRNKIDKPFDKKLIHNVHGKGYVLREEN
ncbi:MAG: response regulator transcription factor [Chitinophagales bacterium]|nr:response regulator transcription factor [Chitinophagales bacterium]MDW8419898.1 response regulator transcription factor [Chitinophagales bacterium]